MYIGMTKSKHLASSIAAPSIFVMHLINGAQVLNATTVGLLYPVLMISPLVEINGALWENLDQNFQIFNH